MRRGPTDSLLLRSRLSERLEARERAYSLRVLIGLAFALLLCLLLTRLPWYPKPRPIGWQLVEEDRRLALLATQLEARAREDAGVPITRFAPPEPEEKKEGRDTSELKALQLRRRLEPPARLQAREVIFENPEQRPRSSAAGCLLHPHRVSGRSHTGRHRRAAGAALRGGDRRAAVQHPGDPATAPAAGLGGGGGIASGTVHSRQAEWPAGARPHATTCTVSSAFQSGPGQQRQRKRAVTITTRRRPFLPRFSEFQEEADPKGAVFPDRPAVASVPPSSDCPTPTGT